MQVIPLESPNETPIAIVLESQDELAVLWHCLNVSWQTIVKGDGTPGRPTVYYPEKKAKVKSEMWSKTNDMVKRILKRVR